MTKNILLIGHRSFLSKEIKEKILKDNNFKIYFLEKYFSENDIYTLSRKNFYEKYFSIFSKIDIIISCIHIHKNKFENELALNTKIYENILYFAELENIKKIIYLSSVNISKNKSLSYAYIKYRVECLINDFKNFVIVRPSTIISINGNKNLTGGGNGTSFNLFEKFFNYNLPIPIIGDGKYKFTYCFLEDVANFIIFLVRDDMFLNKKINFFSGEFLDFNTFIDNIGKVKNKRVNKIHIPLFFINLLCKLKIFNKKNIDNLLNQKIYYNYNDLIKEKIQINKLKSFIE